jgi:hypothetical protein
MAPDTKTCIYKFLLAAFFFLFFSLFSFGINIRFFAAPFAMLPYLFPLSQCVWIAFTIGCFLDVMQGSLQFGFFGAAYMLAIMLLFRLRRFFFQDDPGTLAIMTYLFSIICSLTEAILAIILEIPSPLFSFSWIFTDCLIMSLFDVAFALLLILKLPEMSMLRMKRRIKAARGQ